MLIFSDLSHLNLEQAVINAIKYIKITPPSILAGCNGNLADNQRVVPSLSETEFRILAPNASIFDMRSSDEFQSHHIAHSTHIGSLPELNDLNLTENAKCTIIIAKESQKILPQLEIQRIVKVPSTVITTLDPSLLCNCRCIGDGSTLKCSKNRSS